MQTLYGSFIFFLILLFSLLYCVLYLCLYLLCHLIPFRQTRTRAKQKLLGIYRNLCTVCGFLLRLRLNVTVTCDQNTAPLSRDNIYIMIANHQSWFDILLITCFIHPDTSLIKFVMKQELLWQLPFASWFCYLNGFPILKRKSDEKSRHHDLSAITAACKSMCDTPGTLMSFPEGTRFSTKKKQAKQSPFQSLLPPKPKGLSLSIEAMHTHLAGVIDLTIIYHHQRASIGDFLLGRMRDVDLHYQLLSNEQLCLQGNKNLNEHKPEFAAWLNNLWCQKDQAIREHRTAS